MHEWTIERHFHTGTWVLRRDGEIEHTFRRINGSDQSSRQQCERCLAKSLICEYFKECPEKGYRVAYHTMKLVEKSGLTVKIDKAVMG